MLLEAGHIERFKRRGGLETRNFIPAKVRRNFQLRKSSNFLQDFLPWLPVLPTLGYFIEFILTWRRKNFRRPAILRLKQPKCRLPSRARNTRSNLPGSPRSGVLQSISDIFQHRVFQGGSRDGERHPQDGREYAGVARSTF